MAKIFEGHFGKIIVEFVEIKLSRSRRSAR